MTQVKGNAVFPGAGMFEAMRATGVILLANEQLSQHLALAAVVIPAPLFLTPGKVRFGSALAAYLSSNDSD